MANKMTDEQLRKMCENAKNLGFRSERLMLLDQRLTEWTKNPVLPSIAVKILRHGETAFEAAYGIQGPDMTADSLTVDTIFPVCSLTKPVTAALICIMQEEGLVDINKPVSLYLPEYTGDTSNIVSIETLLTHTSGLVDQDQDKNFKDYVTNKLGLVIPGEDDSKEAWMETFVKIREKMGLPYMEPSEHMKHMTFMAVTLTYTPTNKPKTVMAYCSTGYQMVMDIIKRISGRKIDDYASEKLFIPLKMVDTHFIFPKEKIPRYIQRGEGAEGREWLNESILNSESGSGGLKSTVNDFTRFGQMFLNDGVLDDARVLSHASIREILRDHNEKILLSEYKGIKIDSTWGLGWNIKGTKIDDSGILRSSKSFEHGGFGGVKILCDPEADIVAAYFAINSPGIHWHGSEFNNMVLAAIDSYGSEKNFASER